MIEELNEWYVSLSMNITKETLNERSEAVTFLGKNATIEDICNLVKIFYGLPIDNEFRDKFVQCINKYDATFSITYSEEINLLAGSVLAYIAKNKWELGYLVELLVLTSSYYHKPVSTIKIQECILNQLNIDQVRLRKAKEFEARSSDILDQLKEKIKTDEENWGIELIDFLIEQDKKNNELLKTLQVYKEDSQILWWMNSQWSNTLNCPLIDIEKNQACLFIGSEAAEMIENYPGPYSMEAVIKNIIKNCRGIMSDIEIEKVISAADDAWKKDIVASSKKVFFVDLLPIYSAINRSDNTTSKEQWYPKYEQEVLVGNSFKKISQEEYAFRMYLEELTVKLYLSVKK